MTNNFNKKPNFPITYGDPAADIEHRLSDTIIEQFSDPETQKYLTIVKSIFLNPQIKMLDHKSYIYNYETPIFIFENKKMLKTFR